MSFLRHHNPEPSDKSITLAEQQNALIEWATNIDMEPKWRKEIMRKISKMDRVLEGDEYERFITELAELKLGIGVTEDEALEIMRLSEKANAAKESGNEADYIAARTEFNDYVEELKAEDEPL
jgi:hypothetical protein